MQEAAPNSFKQMRVETLAIMGVVVAAIVILFIVLSGRPYIPHGLRRYGERT